MKNFGSGKSLFARSAVAIAALGAGASAFADLSPIIFSVQASNSNGAGSWSVAYDPINDGPDGFFWNGGPQTIVDGDGDEIAIVELASMSAFSDPAVGLTFTVQALAANTNFLISSAVLSFPTIAPATGIASCGLTVTDSDTSSSASASGNIGATGGSICVASYNGGTIFGENINPVSTNVPAGTATGNYSTGLQPIGSVSSIALDYGFTLSANDSASATAVFFVIPEPSSLALIGLGVVALIRRR
ncbi:MAG: PEP-CTERM sorting domain-containing protein [Phycisphaerae bacterium]